MEGIEACVENVDDTVIPELSSQLITMIKKAVGLPTKVRHGLRSGKQASNPCHPRALSF